MVEFTISHPYGSGQYATRVRIYSGLARIDIQTTLVNNDERVRYRAAFPTSIRAGKITYEIPFGVVERPEGELPAQNWIDTSDGEHGVTLLNQGLPGNNVVDGVMMLSLLKCTGLEGGYGEMKLGPATQQGYEKGITHTFDYALVAHGGDWRAAQAYRRGAEFNVPLIVHKPGQNAGSLPAKLSFLRLSAENVVLSAVKACPEGIIVRIYEAEGRSANEVDLELAWPVKAACEVNLIEKDETPIPGAYPSRHLTLSLTPFEIKTLRLTL
jgi:alpha-mannosidase